MRLRILLSLGIVASSFTAAKVNAETDQTEIPPALAVQVDPEGIESKLTEVAEVFQPEAQPAPALEDSETEDEIINYDPAPPKPAPAAHGSKT